LNAGQSVETAQQVIWRNNYIEVNYKFQESYLFFLHSTYPFSHKKLQRITFQLSSQFPEINVHTHAIANLGLCGA
jgi:uncharacterized membrane-anchored protein